MVYCMDDEFFLHVDGENGLSILKVFVPPVIRVCVWEWERVLGALAVTEDDHTHFPVDNQIMAFEPVMAEVEVLRAEVSDR